MYTDFHDDVMSTYGVADGPARVVKILGLIEDLTNELAGYKELQMVGKIFADIPDTEPDLAASELNRLGV